MAGDEKWADMYRPPFLTFKGTTCTRPRRRSSCLPNRISIDYVVVINDGNLGLPLNQTGRNRMASLSKCNSVNDRVIANHLRPTGKERLPHWWLAFNSASSGKFVGDVAGQASLWLRKL